LSENTPISHPKQRLLTRDIDGYDVLAELALDMHSSWNHTTDPVWRELDPELWALTQNPWVVLQTVSREKLKTVLADSAFR
jgi:starch phosphorylase